MSRRKRVQFPSAVYHVMSRGNRKGSIFEDDEDRRLLVQILEEGTQRYGARCFAMCLMGNHYHFVLDTPRGNLSDTMRYINGVYALRTNRRHKRTGHVFEARFRSIVVQREGYLRRVTRYVVRNPLRANLVTDVAAWPWSSFAATAGLAPVPDWLHLDWMEVAFNTTSRSIAQARYVQFVNDPVEKKNMHVPVLGDDDFAAAVKEAARRRWPDRPLPRALTALARPALKEIFSQAQAPGTQRDAMIHAAHVNHGYHLAEIAKYLSVDKSVMTRALQRYRGRSD